jgi:putative serine protease PepD
MKRLLVWLLLFVVGISLSGILGATVGVSIVANRIRDIDPTKIVHEVRFVNETVKKEKIQYEESSSVTEAIKQVKQAVVEIRTRSTAGSGFVVSSNGLIVTNRHVVEGDLDYSVKTIDGASYKVIEVIKDPTNDIAFIRIKARNLSTVEFGSSDQLVPGQMVIAIGNPLGFTDSASMGIVSATNRDLEVYG